MNKIDLPLGTLVAFLVSATAASADTFSTTVTKTTQSYPPNRIEGQVDVGQRPPSSFDSATAAYALRHPKPVLDQDMKHYRTALPGRLLY